jgi:cation diffusion facilitator CzcD-associated flavoprotein CzcO
LRVDVYSKERSFVPIHSGLRANFKGKAVAVLGIGSNAADIATALVGNTSSAYLPHRGGVNIVALPSV